MSTGTHILRSVPSRPNWPRGNECSPSRVVEPPPMAQSPGQRVLGRKKEEKQRRREKDRGRKREIKPEEREREEWKDNAKEPKEREREIKPEKASQPGPCSPPPPFPMQELYVGRGHPCPAGDGRTGGNYSWRTRDRAGRGAFNTPISPTFCPRTGENVARRGRQWEEKRGNEERQWDRRLEHREECEGGGERNLGERDRPETEWIGE